MSDGYFRPESDPHLFRCRCGRPDCEAPTGVHPALLLGLNELRSRVGRPLRATSGNRCAWWNRQQGGVDDGDDCRYTEDDSEHCDPTGTTGADLACVTARERDELLVAIYARPRLFRRLGIGPDFVHVGTSILHPQQVCWTYYPNKPHAPKAPAG